MLKSDHKLTLTSRTHIVESNLLGIKVQALPNVFYSRFCRYSNQDCTQISDSQISFHLDDRLVCMCLVEEMVAFVSMIWWNGRS